jgi:hypothetical protein
MDLRAQVAPKFSIPLSQPELKVKESSHLNASPILQSYFIYPLIGIALPLTGKPCLAYFNSRRPHATTTIPKVHDTPLVHNTMKKFAMNPKNPSTAPGRDSNLKSKCEGCDVADYDGWYRWGLVLQYTMVRFYFFCPDSLLLSVN